MQGFRVLGWGGVGFKFQDFVFRVSSRLWFSLQGSWVVGTLQVWEFPKIRGTLFWDPYNKDPII